MSDRPLLRPAVLADAPAVRACLAEAFAPYRARYTPAAYADTVPTVRGVERRIRERSVWVAEAGDVVGTVGGEVRAEGEGHLRGMAVRPGWQGSGLAARLLATAEAALHARGCDRVTLDTTGALARAAAFYSARGYRPTGRTSDFFGVPVTEYARALP